MKKNLLLLASMLVVACVSFAQPRFSLHLGGLLPVGDFGKGRCDFENERIDWALLNEEERYGCAGLGVDLGLKLNVPVSSVGLSVYASADFMYNGYNSDLKYYLSDFRDGLDLLAQESDVLVSWNMKTPRVFNIPVTIGLQYSRSLSSAMDMFFEVGVGPNIRVISPFVLSGRSEMYGQTSDFSIRMGYDPAVTLAYQLGMGIMLNKHYSIGLHYFSLGNSRIEVTERLEENGSVHFEDEAKWKIMPCANVALRLGYHF